MPCRSRSQLALCQRPTSLLQFGCFGLVPSRLCYAPLSLGLGSSHHPPKAVLGHQALSTMCQQRSTEHNMYIPIFIRFSIVLKRYKSRALPSAKSLQASSLRPPALSGSSVGHDG
ncbi:hypothetical protein BD310DRAFT_930247 [Dichomitus squalens]|uniref:Uncharacterized protein n=1 Tax=Dichomitus squalens TaxID=114155 RepID=A0A4Q9PRN7_9APHY|nr:hypothetical protein BD310DRAFT_930247 [Dichomitus squalens]